MDHKKFESNIKNSWYSVNNSVFCNQQWLAEQTTVDLITSVMMYGLKAQMYVKMHEGVNWKGLVIILVELHQAWRFPIIIGVR